MMSKILIEFLSTVVFVFCFFVFSSGNYLVIPAILALIMYFTKGFALVNPAISFAKWVEGTIDTTLMLQLVAAEMVGAVIGFEIYSIVYKRGLTFRK